MVSVLLPMDHASSILNFLKGLTNYQLFDISNSILFISSYLYFYFIIAYKNTRSAITSAESRALGVDHILRYNKKRSCRGIPNKEFSIFA